MVSPLQKMVKSQHALKKYAKRSGDELFTSKIFRKLTTLYELQAGYTKYESFKFQEVISIWENAGNNATN
jgi:hypothetical protein